MPTSLKNKKFLVTGCAGFIGSFVTEALIKKGAYVYGIDNLNTGSVENIKHLLTSKQFSFIQGNFCEIALMEKLVKKVDYVYHAAVRGIGLSTANPLEELRVNIEGTLQLLELMRGSKVKRMIYASSASVYGNAVRMPEREIDPVSPLSPYGVSKLAAEQYALVYHHLYNLPVVALRYFNVYGPRQRSDSLYGGVISIFIHNALQGKPLYLYGDGKQTRDFTYIDDVASATLASFTAKGVLGKVINIAGGKEYKIADIAQKIKKITGNKNLPIRYTKKRLVDNVERRSGDIILAKKLLNYSPQTNLAEGLGTTYAWYKQNKI